MRVELERQRLDLKSPVWAGVLAWLVPGLGHLYQGRVGKAALYFVCITGLMLVGMWLGEWRVAYWTMDPERRYLIDGTCRLGIGFVSVPAVLQSVAETNDRVRGLIAPVLGSFLATPTLAELRDLNARLNVYWEIAKLYTMIAGLLNVLVVWDACRGPALEEAEAGEPAPPQPKPESQVLAT
jgi:predicted small integral membrane protein